jgi:hypothetical protein
MNVAILLSGHFRTTEYQKLFNLYKNNLIDINKNYNFDFFISTWSDTGLRKNFDYDLDRNDGIVPGDKIEEQKIKDIFNPVFLKIENFEEKYDYFKQKTKKIYELRDEYIKNFLIDPNLLYNRILANCSMWYKWSDVEKLKNNYKTSTNKKYDCVIKTRCDLIFKKPFPFDLKEYSNKKIITPPWPDTRRPYSTDLDFNKQINDWWMAGDESLIEIINSLYDSYENIFEEMKEPDKIKDFLNPHRLPVYFLEKNGVDIAAIHRLPIPCTNQTSICSRTNIF